jgi:large subunit ribosomal protein L6
MAEQEKMEIPIPDGASVELTGKTLTVTGEKGSITRTFKAPSITIEKGDKIISVLTASRRKKDMAVMGAVRSHIANMVHGVQEGYEYSLKIFYAHFPMNVSVEENRVKIDNFLGEKYPRYARIVGDTQVKISGDVITVSGIDKESVGQTAANLEQATRIKEKDPRVFQDGIYLFEKDGVKIK